jgi:hypothetical protein
MCAVASSQKSFSLSLTHYLMWGAQQKPNSKRMPYAMLLGMASGLGLQHALAANENPNT